MKKLFLTFAIIPISLFSDDIYLKCETDQEYVESLQMQETYELTINMDSKIADVSSLSPRLSGKIRIGVQPEEIVVNGYIPNIFGTQYLVDFKINRKDLEMKSSFIGYKIGQCSKVEIEDNVF